MFIEYDLALKLMYIQWNLSITATLGTEESGLCREVAVIGS